MNQKYFFITLSIIIVILILAIAWILKSDNQMHIADTATGALLGGGLPAIIVFILNWRVNKQQLIKTREYHEEQEQKYQQLIKQKFLHSALERSWRIILALCENVIPNHAIIASYKKFRTPDITEQLEIIEICQAHLVDTFPEITIKFQSTDNLPNKETVYSKIFIQILQCLRTIREDYSKEIRNLESEFNALTRILNSEEQFNIACKECNHPEINWASIVGINTFCTIMKNLASTDINAKS